MKRRAILARSAVLGAVGLAGCLSGNDPGTGTPTDGDGTDPTTEPPAIDAATIETLAADCTSEGPGGASLAADADSHRLTVTGTLRAPNPCHLARLRGTGLQDGVLAVTVGSEPGEAEACVDCVGALEYEATIVLRGGASVEVVVAHDVAGAVTEVHSETVEL